MNQGRRGARALFVIWVLALTPYTTSAQETGPDAPGSPPPGTSPFTLGTDLSFGVVSFVDQETGETLTYQQIALRPDIAVGPFGVGLNLALNYRFTGGDGSEFEVREEDWVPGGEINFVELYLPKINYVRYGRKEDPLYVLFGSFSDATLGNGFILENYSNELFRPQRRIFGGSVDIDGSLVGFPYVGIETVAANAAAWDVMAARLYVRPLAALSVPILPNLQFGGTVAVDRDPYYHVRKNEDPDNPFQDVSAPSDPVYMWGVDTRLPILTSDILSLATFGDVVRQDTQLGGMIGLGGQFLGFLRYGAQVRLYEDNFTPTYFNRSYDRRRVERYDIYRGETPTEGAFGWLGRLGFAVLGNALVFETTMSGPLEEGTGTNPELQSTLTLAEGALPGLAGFSFQGYYEKFDISSAEDLVDPENAIIGARFNIRSGPVVVSLVYDLTYDPLAEGDPWTVSSGLETTISF